MFSTNFLCSSGEDVILLAGFILVCIGSGSFACRRASR
jgi:hypothetical protein